MKNFSLISSGNGLRLAPAYDLLNTELHIEGTDFALLNGFSSNFDKSEVYESTGHPYKRDFASFGEMIGLKEKEIDTILKNFFHLPDEAKKMIEESLLSKKQTLLF